MEESVVFTHEFNVWNGRRELRLRVLDVDISPFPTHVKPPPNSL